MKKTITIDPLTRLEGHGRIELFLDGNGDVERAVFRVAELRGFEKFCEERPAEEMPRVTTRICGVCPTAHHIASVKALDDLYRVAPPPAAKKIRELLLSAFILEDHFLHFFFLGGPDFFVGPDAPSAEKNMLGVLKKIGVDNINKVIQLRKKCREILALIGGKATHPVCGLPGGISRRLRLEDQEKIKDTAHYALEFCRFALKVFEGVFLNKKSIYREMLTGDLYHHATYYMGMVDDENRVNFYDGSIRVVDPDGKEFCRFNPRDYIHHIEEHVEPWSYALFPFLKKIGWHGFTGGSGSGIYRVGPMARLNVAEGMATSLAQKEYEKMYNFLGEKPAHNILAFHWARLIESLSLAERLVALADDPDLIDPHVRNIPEAVPSEGTGAIEAPRGTLFHHYRTDENGIIKTANLVVPTTGNAAAINLTVNEVARALIKSGTVPDRLLSRLEMGCRAYDPCLACATH